MADDAALSDEAVARIAAVMGDQYSSPLIEMIAQAYLELKRRAESSAGRGLKLDLRRLAKTVRGTAQALNNVDVHVPVAIAVAGQLPPHRDSDPETEPDRWIRDIRPLASKLERLADAIDHALAVLPGRMQQIDVPMEVTIGLLETCFQRNTGKRATHSSQKDGEYVGEPLSDFGRFCVAFFAEVDPRVTRRTVANSLEKRLWKRRPRPQKNVKERI
jgi:hypothetical protein